MYIQCMHTHRCYPRSCANALSSHQFVKVPNPNCATQTWPKCLIHKSKLVGSLAGRHRAPCQAGLEHGKMAGIYFTRRSVGRWAGWVYLPLPAPAGQLGLAAAGTSRRVARGACVRARAWCRKATTVPGLRLVSQHVTCSAQPASSSCFRGLRRLPPIATSAPQRTRARGWDSETAASRRASTSPVCVCLSVSAGRRAASLCRRDGVRRWLLERPERFLLCSRLRFILPLQALVLWMGISN